MDYDLLSKIFEMGMLIFFGFSWPFNIRSTLKRRSSVGKSFAFMSCVLVGYLCGIAAKCVPGHYSWVIWFWVINTLMVATDLVLCVYFYKTVDKSKLDIP